MSRRRALRIDANQPPTVNLLRSVGWSVSVTSSLGDGFPDLVCSRKGFTAVVELKNREGGGMTLTDDEVKFRDDWQGPYVLADGPEDALSKLEAAREAA